MEKRMYIFMVLGLLVVGTLAMSGCTEEEESSPLDKPITVVERKEGSGTRGTFMEAVGLESVESDVKKGENAGVKETVKNSDNSIGYVGLGYVSDETPAITLDGMKPTEETVGNGDYPITRGLHMYTDGEPADGSLIDEFLKYVMSKEGQKIVSEEGFVKVAPNTDSYEKVDGLSGDLSISGSSTVLPIAQSAAEDFNEIYDNVNVQVSGGGSGQGIKDLATGVSGIGDASRPVKDSEKDEYSDTDFTDHVVARGGVAVIVSKEIYDEGITELTMDEVKDIYEGNIENWKELED